MTILAGFSATRHGPAPLNLAAQIACTTGDDVVAAAVVERPWPSRDDTVEKEYLRYVVGQAEQSLERVVAKLPQNVRIRTGVYESTSVPAGLTEIAMAENASLVVFGSSSSGLLGRVTLGSVTERMVHTAKVPVAVAPRGYPAAHGPVRRLTAAYGGESDVNGLIPAAAELAKEWSAALRIASFAVRNVAAFRGKVESSAEDLVVQQWIRRTHDDVVAQLDDLRQHMTIPDVDMVVGSGHDWASVIDSVPWAAGDVLVLGSGAAGQAAQVFLGSAAGKILRNAPVPVMIVPRYQPG